MRRLAAAVAACGACTAITEFDTARVVEDDPALCADGADNDRNGLADCQDFGCLAVESCCTIPAVVLRDTFDALACAAAPCDAPDPTCAAIDPGRWQSWGSPEPVVCEGALSPHKLEQCYDVGVYSVDELALEPGLIVSADVVGLPEVRGRLELGLTFQDQIVGSTDPCDAIATVVPAASIQLLADEGGARFVATFDGDQVGVSPLVADAGPHAVRIEIGEDRRARYALDGAGFGESPAAQPIPDTVAPVRLTLSGRGMTARFDAVRVTAGTQCDAPDAWEPLEPFELLAPTGDDTHWDGFAVYAPALAPAAGGYTLYYSGCRERLGGCDDLLAGIGTASAADDLAFTRDADCPIIGTSGAVCAGGLETGSPFDNAFNNMIDVTLATLGGQRIGYLSQLADGPEIAAVDLDDFVVMPDAAWVRTGAPGSWDAHEVCCATALERGGTVELWYAGRADADAPWQIGRAVSDDGVSFVKSGGNPVLRPGAAGAFDDRGVGEPTVVFDATRQLYRMWYTATAFFGASSVGYAVSTDGARWFKAPDNPVVSPAELDLSAVGSPHVTQDEGRLLMLLTGTTVGGRGTRIYGAVNRGEAFVATGP